MASGQDVVERLRVALADRYRIEREIGSGGMATVYLAQDLKHNRQVAVKVLNPMLAEALGADRFLLEIETVANLTHPHILPLHDSGDADGFLFFVMPYVKGDTLRTRLEKEGALPIEDGVRITREIASALTYANEEGVIHRDVKPANIMLEAGHAVLGDFGVAHALAKAEDERITKTGTSLGTPIYISPEQVTGERDLDGRSDQYALACVLFEMLAGQPPFEGPTAKSLLHQHLAVDPPSIDTLRPEAPPQVTVALDRALAKDPSDRFETTNQFAEALVGSGTEVIGWAGLTKRARRRRALAGLVGLAVVAIVGFAVRRYLVGSADPGAPPADRPYTVLATVEGSADPAMRETVEYLLRSALDMAHVIQTVPNTEVRRLLRLMERPDTALLDPATARELAERAGVNTAVLPRLDAVGDGFLVAARVEEVRTGHLLEEASHQAAGPDQVVATVDAVSMDLRRGMGETRAALANTDPLPQVLTSSLSALRKYREARALHVNFQPGRAIPLFREALALDPEFSEAFSGLAAAYHNFGDPDSELENIRHALENPERLREETRRYIEGRLRYESDFALWDESLFRTGASGNLNAIVLVDFQHFDSAFTLVKSDIRERERQHRRFDPGRPFTTGQLPVLRNVTKLAITNGRLDEFEVFMDSLRIDLAEFSELNLSLGAADWERADSIRLSVPAVSWESHVSKRIAVASLDVVRGRVQKGYGDFASIHSQRVIPERMRLLLEVVFGLEGTDQPVSLQDRGRKAVDRYVVHGVRSAILGDTLEGKRVAARMAAVRDSATSEMFEEAFHPMFTLLDAGIAGQRDGWTEVTRLLQPCADRFGESGYGYNTDRFLVRWVLGNAYAQLGQPERAIQQLEALLLERSFEPFNVLVFAPTQFKLAQLRSQTGETERALEHYQAFLDAFIEPDPEFEWMVDEARTAVSDQRG